MTPVIAGLLMLAALVATGTDLRARDDDDARAALLMRSQVWAPTDVAAMDIRTGPTGPGAFPYHATVHCEYTTTDLGGRSPKFGCETADGEELKVKYGGTNGEVYAEVAATRLLWALGFGADHLYPVQVVCSGCPSSLYGTDRGNGEYLFDPATVERKMPAAELYEEWSWRELATVSEEAGGAPRAHRDALTLLAVFLQHTDSKAGQQRLVCLGQSEDELEDDPSACRRPFLMVNDVGLTFGKANWYNTNDMSGMNLNGWKETPVWADDEERCVGNLPPSFSGTLDNPVISEEGRAFLADLLVQLTDQQIHDLFAVSRVTLRTRTPDDPRSGLPAVEEWVAAFKDKRDQIVNRRCA